MAGEIAKRAERQKAAKEAAARVAAAASAAGGGGSSSRGSSSRVVSSCGSPGGGTPATPRSAAEADRDMEELVAARMERLTSVLGAVDDAEEEDDDDDEDGGWDEVLAVDDAPLDVTDGSGGVAGGGAAGGGAAGGDGAMALPHGYLLKLRPAASSSLLKKFSWQRRWFEVTADEFLCWYASSRAAAEGSEPLGRVPLSMVLEARAHADSGRFDVDLGNRCLQLALDNVPKAKHQAIVRQWIGALVKEVVGDVQAQPQGHKEKWWKPTESPAKSKGPGK